MGSITFSRQGEIGDKVEILENEADRLPPEIGSLIVVHGIDVDIIDESLPAVGVLRAPSMERSVDLPEPDWPMTAMNSPVSMVKLISSTAVTAAISISIQLCHMF